LKTKYQLKKKDSENQKKNEIEKNIKDIQVSEEDKIKKLKPSICDRCVNPASRYCHDCQIPYCDECWNTIHLLRFAAHKSDKLYTQEDYQTIISSRENTTRLSNDLMEETEQLFQKDKLEEEDRILGELEKLEMHSEVKKKEGYL